MTTPSNTSEEGATLAEQIIEAARRNNLELLEHVLVDAVKDIDESDEKKRIEAIAKLINGSRDPLGNSVLHITAQTGSYEVMDHILDQEGVEVDPVNLLAGDTPLHCAVRYALTDEPEHGTFIVEELIDAGTDPRIRNKHGQKPIDLVSDNEKLEEILRGAEFALMFGRRASEQQEALEAKEEAEEEGEGSGSSSESEH